MLPLHTRRSVNVLWWYVHACRGLQPTEGQNNAPTAHPFLCCVQVVHAHRGLHTRLQGLHQARQAPGVALQLARTAGACKQGPRDVVLPVTT